jgi:hypothetical protein
VDSRDTRGYARRSGETRGYALGAEEMKSVVALLRRRVAE